VASLEADPKSFVEIEGAPTEVEEEASNDDHLHCLLRGNLGFLEEEED
jgi:hypothetical protein